MHLALVSRMIPLALHLRFKDANFPVALDADSAKTATKDWDASVGL